MQNYEKIRLVGRGAHGTVYLCNRKIDSKLVILKEIPVDQMSVDERQASMNEAKVLAMLDHPNVVAYYESFLDDKTMVIVMEYVQGGTLFDFLHERNGDLLSEEEVLHYFGQMVYTLQHVHGKLILHRDLKSQNILLNEKKNIVKIGDFGISKILSSKSKAFTVVGTPCYISPELCEGKPYNQKSDIWALGCVLYELMTLKRPFDACTLPALIMKIMKGSFDPVPNIYSNELKELLLSMLHLDPNERPSAAHIMCHPIMIKVVYKLYLEVGSIPFSKRSHKNYSMASFSNEMQSSKYSSFHSDSLDTLKNKLSVETKTHPKIWVFQSEVKHVDLLSPPPKDIIKCVTLGLNHKTGITESGLLINWKIYPGISVSRNLESCENVLQAVNTAYIIDEKAAVNIISVVCGNDFTICLSNNGVVFSFGKVASGCLGISGDEDAEQPRIIESLFSYNITAIACGPRHVLAISDESELFSWGYGNQGCLGLGSIDFQPLPELVQVSSKCEPDKVFCGIDCSFIISTDLSVWACGSNRHNKLAMDSEDGHQIEEILQFTQISPKHFESCGIVFISSGRSHSVFLTENGQVYSVGSNNFSQLGWGNSSMDYSMPQKIEDLSIIKIDSIKCGENFTLAVSNDNYLYCWGKCPKSLMDKGDSDVCHAVIPRSFKKRRVFSISCYSENCIIVGQDY